MNHMLPRAGPDVQSVDRPRLQWDFRLASVVSPSTSLPPSSDIIGAVELDPSDRLLATAGIARKIRIYTLSSILPSAPSSPARLTSSGDFYLFTPAKLSCLRFLPLSSGRLLSAADYDGVVTEYDLDHLTTVSERDDHGGRRVWSVDFHPDGGTAASGADDGAARTWDPRCPASGAAVAVHTGSAPVCCVEFDRADRGPWLAIGCADRKAYVYDLRASAAGPLSAFAGHQRTVTYVRFAGGGRMVSSGTDGTHRMWEVGNGTELQAYRGHRNSRSFVGMALWRAGGLIGCGSETNEAYVYDLRWCEPVWVGGFGRADDGFVSSVCFRGGGSDDECGLIAGGSNGVIKVFWGRRNVPRASED